MEERPSPHARGQISINAAPDVVYRVVSDPVAMVRFAQEVYRVRWIDGATGPAPSARFKGTNKRGFIRCSTKPEVVTADRGREFAFVTHSAGPSTKWSYRFETAAGGGTELVESFELLDDDSPLVTFVERHVMRIEDRRADLEAGMQKTLGRIKAVAEGAR